MPRIIKEAKVEILRTELVSPFRIATGQHNELENVLLTITLSSEVKGFGEAAVATHITGETIPQTITNLKKVAAELIGYDISRPLLVCMEFAPYFKGNHAALAAFEMAVFDAFTRSRGIPFWRLFGLKPARFQTDITIVIGSLEEAERSAAEFYRQGFRTFKVKIGRDEALDFRRVLAVKTRAPKADIILDANQAFGDRQILKFLKFLRAQGVHPVLIEQPVPKQDIDGMAKVTREAKTLVCADESAANSSDVELLIRKKAASAINIKFMKSGILESVEIARLAKAAGLKLMIGAMMESSLAITASAHFAAGLGGFDFIDLDTTFFIKGPLSQSPYLDGKGRFDLRKAGPGIGINIKQGGGKR